VDVIPLHGELEDPEAHWVAPRCATQCDTERRKDVLAAKRSKSRTQRHVNGMSRAVLRSRAMRHGPPSWSRPAACPHASPAPCVGECELLLHPLPLGAALRGKPASGSLANAHHLKRAIVFERGFVTRKRGFLRFEAGEGGAPFLMRKRGFLRFEAGEVGSPFHPSTTRRRSSASLGARRRPRRRP
jgi:hypothetical protein